MNPVKTLGVLSLPVIFLGCNSQQPGPDDWYRVDPLFIRGKTAEIQQDGSLNPYLFRFEGQAPAPAGRDAASASITTLSSKVNNLYGTNAIVATDESASGIRSGQLAQLTLAETSTAYAAAQLDPNNRNRFIALLITQSDTLVGGHVAAIIGTQNANELALGGTALVTSALATALTPIGTKTALSAASTVASGTRTAVREQIYSNAFGWAIAQAILEEREDYLKDRIIPRLSESVTAYSIDQALADIQIYHEKGSFYNGLIEINKRIASGSLPSNARFSTALPIPTLDVPASATSPIKPDNTATEVSLRVTLAGLPQRAFRLKFNDVAAVALAPGQDPRAILASGKPADNTFEARLAGTFVFQVTPKVIEIDENNAKVKKPTPILIDLRDTQGNLLYAKIVEVK